MSVRYAAPAIHGVECITLGEIADLGDGDYARRVYVDELRVYSICLFADTREALLFPHEREEADDA
jgi:hypothetical protein